VTLPDILVSPRYPTCSISSDFAECLSLAPVGLHPYTLITPHGRVDCFRAAALYFHLPEAKLGDVLLTMSIVEGPNPGVPMILGKSFIDAYNMYFDRPDGTEGWARDGSGLCELGPWVSWAGHLFRGPESSTAYPDHDYAAIADTVVAGDGRGFGESWGAELMTGRAANWGGDAQLDNLADEATTNTAMWNGEQDMLTGDETPAYGYYPDAYRAGAL